MEHASLTIRTSEDLDRLLDNGQHYRSIRVDGPGMPECQRLRWQTHLSHRYAACGCGIGNFFGLAGATAGGVYLTLAETSRSPWLHGAVAFSLVVAVAAVGSWAGVRRERRRLRAAVRALGAVLEVTSASHSGP